MSTYIIRVQLSTETLANYTRLKDQLLKVGFSKKITSNTGKHYVLPNGNYTCKSDKTPSDILEIVQRITARLDRSPMILVTEVKESGMAWAGLPLAKS